MRRRYACFSTTDEQLRQDLIALRDRFYEIIGARSEEKKKPQSNPRFGEKGEIAMKNQTRLLKPFSLALLAGSLALNSAERISAHDGHKHKRAPASQRKQPKARTAQAGDKVEKPRGASLTTSMKRNPARPGSFMSNLTVTPDQRLLLSWVEPGDDQAPALRYAIAQNGLWSEAQTVTSRQAIVSYQSARPVVTLLPDGNLIACWEQYRQGSKPSSQPIDVVFSTSRDGGKTWSDPRSIHRDQSESSHDFVSVTPTGADELAVVWLDGRDMKKQMLMTATIRTDGAVSDEKMLDPDVCSCCPTTLVNTPDGLLVAYRDHEAGEIRDISLLHFTAGQWSAPRNLHRDGWKINGCPSNSVTLDVDGKRVAAAWFTAANDNPSVKAAFSADGGKTFGQPLIVSQGKAIGRTAITLLADGAAAVVWVENVAGSSQVIVSRIGSDGKISAPTMLGKADKSFPRIASVGGQLMATWTAAGSVRTATLSIPAYSAAK